VLLNSTAASQFIRCRRRFYRIGEIWVDGWPRRIEAQGASVSRRLHGAGHDDELEPRCIEGTLTGEDYLARLAHGDRGRMRPN